MNCLGHRCSQWKSRPWLSNETGFPKIIDPMWNEPVSTGSAGALAFPVLAYLFLPNRFGQARQTGYATFAESCKILWL